MSDLTWEAVRGEFFRDGSLRDIYVFGTDLSAWQGVFDRLRASEFEAAFLSDDDRWVALPARAEDAHPPEGRRDCELSVRFAGVTAKCYFFTVDEIEFDINPREVRGQAEFDALMKFMRCLADGAGRDAVLTPESFPEIVIFRVRPGGGPVDHTPFGGWGDPR